MFRTYTALLAIFLGIAAMVTACSSDSELAGEPTPDISATITSAIATALPTPTAVVAATPTPDLPATIIAAIEATKQAEPIPPSPSPTATATQVPIATPAPELGVSGVIYEFSGKGNTTTKKFSIFKNPWKFVWALIPEKPAGLFCSVNLEGTLFPVPIIFELVFEGKYGETLVHDQVGEFYFDITCDEVEWAFAVTYADGGLTSN